ncbi:hypothetical protein D3C85_1907540 [compost metagenome]
MYRTPPAKAMSRHGGAIGWPLLSAFSGMARMKPFTPCASEASTTWSFTATAWVFEASMSDVDSPTRRS